MDIQNCSVEGCFNAKRRNGEKSLYCHMHYKRFRETGSVGSAESKKIWSHRGAECSISGCLNKAEKKTYCTFHYDSARRSSFSVEEVEEFKKNGCYSCTSKERLTLDHDHTICSDKKACEKCFRGVLCHKCNTALGLLGDDLNKIMNLATYLISKKDVLIYE